MLPQRVKVSQASEGSLVSRRLAWAKGYPIDLADEIMAVQCTFQTDTTNTITRLIMIHLCCRHVRSGVWRTDNISALHQTGLFFCAVCLAHSGLAQRVMSGMMESIGLNSRWPFNSAKLDVLNLVLVLHFSGLFYLKSACGMLNHRQRQRYSFDVER